MEDLHLEVIPYELRVATLKEPSRDHPTTSTTWEIRSHFCQQLLECLFPLESLSRGRMFNLTETLEEISIVADQETLARFPSDSISISERPWIPLQVIAGEQGCDSTLLHKLSLPLAEAGIAIFYLSTVQNDYILVDRRQLPLALDCLRKRFVVDIGGVEEVPNLEQEIDQELAQSLRGSPPKAHNLRGDPTPICVQDFKKELIPRLTYSLIQSVFLSSSSASGKFFSYSEVDDEISIMADEKVLEKLLRIAASSSVSSSASSSIPLTSSSGSLSASIPSSFSFGGSSSSRERWRSIRVADGPLGFDECGVVSGIAAALAQDKLPIMYLSTFNTDRVLVLEHHFERALHLLSKTYTVLPS